MIINADKFHDECAVAGIYGNNEASKLIYLCLYAMQHRGQQGSGIATIYNDIIKCEKHKGLVADIFTKDMLDNLSGKIAIGHNRYPTDGVFLHSNLQPITAELPIGECALVYNGNLVNAFKIREQLRKEGAIFSTKTDSETIMHLLARQVLQEDVITALINVMKQITGAYSMLFMYKDTLIGMRDPNGIRPLVLGKMNDSYVLVSESVALDLIDATFVREIEPGEIVIINNDGLKSIKPMQDRVNYTACVFEHVYFARPDSFMFNQSVYEVRKNFGKMLAKEHPVDADFVIPVPDSGISSTIGYSMESQIPFELGIIRNHYVGRTFIEPSQSIRDFGVKIKLNPIKHTIEGKRLIVIDDSIVRGTTSKKIISLLRNAGAKEIHMRISSPPTTNPCYYGIDTPSAKELISHNHSIEEIRQFIGADTLAYLSLEGMQQVLYDKNKFCYACFTGKYPIDPNDLIKG